MTFFQIGCKFRAFSFGWVASRGRIVKYHVGIAFFTRWMVAARWSAIVGFPKKIVHFIGKMARMITIRK
jgi:hypothetical protein